jgi:hypothetical protein
MDQHFAILESLTGQFIDNLSSQIPQSFQVINTVFKDDVQRRQACLIRLNEYKALHRSALMIPHTPTLRASYTTLCNIEKEVSNQKTGAGLYELIGDVQSALELSPPRHALASSHIYRAIHLLKYGWHVIPKETHKDVVGKLNNEILRQNALLDYRERHIGQIIMLVPYDHTVDMEHDEHYKHDEQDNTETYTWRCNDCMTKWKDVLITKNITDIYAPHTCENCKGANIGMFNIEK